MRERIFELAEVINQTINDFDSPTTFSELLIEKALRMVLFVRTSNPEDLISTTRQERVRELEAEIKALIESDEES